LLGREAKVSELPRLTPCERNRSYLEAFASFSLARTSRRQSFWGGPNSRYCPPVPNSRNMFTNTLVAQAFWIAEVKQLRA
jgi:hypothetical protein